MHLDYLLGQGCQSVHCRRFGYGVATENLVSVIFEWKEVLSKANRRGKAQEVHCGLQGVGFGTLYPLVNNSAALCVRSVELFSTTAV